VILHGLSNFEVFDGLRHQVGVPEVISFFSLAESQVQNVDHELQCLSVHVSVPSFLYFLLHALHVHPRLLKLDPRFLFVELIFGGCCPLLLLKILFFVFYGVSLLLLNLQKLIVLLFVVQDELT
jgi:hypothetical protein